MKTIIIDMYGVILKERRGDFEGYVRRHFDESETARLDRMFHEERLYTKVGYGEISSVDFLCRLGFDNHEYHMKRYIDTCLTFDGDFIPFAETYASRYEFVLLSTDVSEWSRYITERYGIDKYIKEKIVSGDVGLRKPDPDVYSLTLERIGRRGEECMFVDDSKVNLDAAAEFGIMPIRFDRNSAEQSGICVSSFAELGRVINGLSGR